MDFFLLRNNLLDFEAKSVNKFQNGSTFFKLGTIHLLRYHVLNRGVVPGGAGGAMAHPDFGRSVNPMSTRGFE